MAPVLVPLRPSSEVTDDPSKLARYLSGMGAVDLPLRASNEGLLRPRVVRAQEINRLHPRLCSGSKGSARVSSTPFIVGALRARRAPGRSFPILLRARVARARGITRRPKKETGAATALITKTVAAPESHSSAPATCVAGQVTNRLAESRRATISHSGIA
jgi:hypothetical protein